jgi:hypothetical protein
MKTKIILAGVITSCAFAFSSFQNFTTNQGYLSIANSHLPMHKTIPSPTVISCAKCHDCQKDALVVEDSSAVKNQNPMVNYNTTSEISEVASQKSSQEKLNRNDAVSPDNFKSN